MNSLRLNRIGAVFCALTAAVTLAACSSTSATGNTGSTGSPGESSGQSSAAGPGTSGSQQAGSGDTSPIVLGGLFTNTPFPFGNDAQKTVEQVFKDVDSAGGINGRQIQYVSGDDGADTTKTAALARKNVDAGAIAMVGSASFTDCGVNRQFYHDNGLIAIQAVGVDPFCFNSPDIASVTVSPFSQVTIDLYYASEVLKDSKLCFFQPVTPGTTDAIVAAVARWQKITGKTLTIDDHTIPTNETTFTTELARAKTAGCDAIIYGGGDAVAAAMLKDAKNQGMSDVDFMYVSVAYTTQLATSAGNLGMNVYATTGLFPYTSKEPATDAWRKVATEAKAQQTAFSEAGYIAANWMVSELKSIKGPITKESVAAAFRGSSTGYASPLVPTPLIFGTGQTHDRTTGVNIVTLKDGAWSVLQAVSLPAGS